MTSSSGMGRRLGFGLGGRDLLEGLGAAQTSRERKPPWSAALERRRGDCACRPLRSRSEVSGKKLGQNPPRNEQDSGDGPPGMNPSIGTAAMIQMMSIAVGEVFRRILS